MMQLEMNFETTLIVLHQYLSKSNDWMLQLVLFYNAGKKYTQSVMYPERFSYQYTSIGTQILAPK